MKKINIFYAVAVSTVIYSTLSINSVFAAAVNCKANLDCMIKAAATCKSAQATSINKSTLGAFTATSKNSLLIKGAKNGKCDYRAKIIDMQYSSEDASSSAQLVEMNKAAKSVIGSEVICTIPKKELIKKLSNFQRGIADISSSDPYCTSAATSALSVTLYVEPGATVGTTIGTKEISIRYKKATDRSATLIITVNKISKVVVLSLNKKRTVLGVGITAVSIEQSTVFTTGKHVGVLIEAK